MALQSKITVLMIKNVPFSVDSNWRISPNTWWCFTFFSFWWEFFNFHIIQNLTLYLLGTGAIQHWIICNLLKSFSERSIFQFVLEGRCIATTIPSIARNFQNSQFRKEPFSMKDCEIICGQVKNFKIVHTFQIDHYLCRSLPRMALDSSATEPTATCFQELSHSIKTL